MALDRFQNPDGYSQQYMQVGGGVPVWRHKPHGYRLVGGSLSSTFQLGEVLHEGSPVYYDAQNHAAKILKCFKVTGVDTSGNNTIITLANNFMTPSLNVGMNLMVAPSTIDGTGKSVTITAVDTTTQYYYKITVATASIDSVEAGDYLVEAASQGSAVKMYCEPNTLLVDDKVVSDINTLSIGRKSECSIYRNLMPDLPDVVLDNIIKENPLIEFEYYNEKQ